MSVNDFYWFGVGDGDTARESGLTATLNFSKFSITNLLKNENVTATSVEVFQ